MKGHATDAMVAYGRVRGEDKVGNDAADIAADFGRLRQSKRLLTLKDICSGLKRSFILV